MKFNFLFISYSVFYAKYSYCFEVPKDMPTRYFDGKEWKLIKTRQHFKTKARLGALNEVPKEFPWAEIIKEIKEIELVSSENTLAIKDTATLRNSNIKTAASSKATIKNFKRPTQATPKKVAVNDSPHFSQLKYTMTAKQSPNNLQMKNFKKPVWEKMRISIRPTVKSAKKVAIKKYFAKTTTESPVVRPTKQLVTTQKPANLLVAHKNSVNLSKNWSKLLKDFLKFVELKECIPPCKPGTITKDKSLVADNQSGISHADDLMNILMDGVQIDDKLRRSEDLAFQRRFMTSKETLENEDNVQDGNVISDEDAISATKKQQYKTALSQKEFKKEYAKPDYEVSPTRSSEAYFNELDDRSTKTSDEIVKSSEIKSYFEALHDKHVKKENKFSEDKGIEASYGEENNSHLRKSQNKDIRKHINDQYLYGENDEGNSLDFSKDTLDSIDLNEITDDMASKHTDSIEIKSQSNYEDVYQDRDITLDLEALENDDVEADKYSTESNEEQGREFDYDEEAVNGINDQKDDISAKN